MDGKHCERNAKLTLFASKTSTVRLDATNPKYGQVHSMQWRHSSSPTLEFKQASSVRKIMATVFWDRKGILLIDFLECGLTINADAYCETVRKLRRAIQNKRRGMLSSGIVLLHDNARPHTAARTAQLLQQFRCEVFDHPPYSPDLAASDYHVFMHLKKWLCIPKL